MLDGRWRGRPATGKMMSLLAQSWVLPAALRRVARILEVLVWRCRARLSNGLGSFLKRVMTARMLVAGSPRGRAIIRDLNVFALNFLETGGIGRSESCEKVGYSILPTDQLHFVVSTL